MKIYRNVILWFYQIRPSQGRHTERQLACCDPNGERPIQDVHTAPYFYKEIQRRGYPAEEQKDGESGKGQSQWFSMISMSSPHFEHVPTSTLNVRASRLTQLYFWPSFSRHRRQGKYISTPGAETSHKIDPELLHRVALIAVPTQKAQVFGDRNAPQCDRFNMIDL